MQTSDSSVRANRFTSVRSIAHRLACNFFKSLSNNETVHHVLALSIEEQRALVTNVFLHNQAPRTLPTTTGSEVYKYTSSFGIINKLNQLPCNLETRFKRADLFVERGYKDKKILLLGDDDLLAVELSKRGFKYVTVADFDRKLVDTIRESTADCEYPPTCVWADFTTWKMPDYEPDVVCFDPPYNYAGAEMFLDCAVKHINFKKEVAAVIMINPYSMGHNDYSMFLSLVCSKGFGLSKHAHAFNSYPLNRMSILTLNILRLFFISVPGLSALDSGAIFFSDCLELLLNNNN